MRDVHEPFAMRLLVAAMALVLVLLFFAHARAYRVPAHAGVDQNGYLVGGKLLAQTLSMRFAPVLPGTAETFDPHQFVGNMWVGADLGTPDESYYPKYPLGLPLLVAIGQWIGEASGSAARGIRLAYWISPVAMTLSVLATFLLARRFVRSSAFALLAAAVYATSPVTLGLTNNPNSHAAAVCFVTWGVYTLLRWHESGGAWRASVAGLLLGYAATIRYSEGALLVAILFVIAISVSGSEGRVWRYLRTLRESGWLLLGWLAPVAVLVGYNLLSMGRITGYDSTNESVGFSWNYAADNWETLVRHLNTYGLSLLLPVALCGMVWMFRHSWQHATLLMLWVAPCVLIYTFYYWAPDGLPNQLVPLGYVRFFMTILPALTVAAFWCLERVALLAGRLDAREPVRRISRATLATLSAGALAGLVVIVQLQNALPLVEGDQIERLGLITSSEEILNDVPPGSVLFTPETRLLQHLQFAADFTLYSGQTFNLPFMQSLGRTPDQPDDPQALDPGRREAVHARLKDLDQAKLDDAARKIVQAALEKDRRVFVAMPRRERDAQRAVRRNRQAQQRAGRDRVARAVIAVAPNEPPNAGGAPERVALDPALMRALPPDRFDVDVVAHWNLLAPRIYEVSPTRGPRLRQPPSDRRQSFFQLIEITRRPATSSSPPRPAPPKTAPPATAPAQAPPPPATTTAPAPHPATTPAASPASTPAQAPATAPSTTSAPTSAPAP